MNLKKNCQTLISAVGQQKKNWEVFRDNVYETSLSILGKNSHKHQDWFDENDGEITELLERKRNAYIVHQQDIRSVSKKAAYDSVKSKVQACLRVMQDSWLSRKADKIQMLADSHSPRFFDALKSIYGPAASGTSPLLNNDGSQLLTEKSAILDRWAEHFENVLNRPSTINEAAIARIPQVETNFSLDEPPTEEEVLKAVELLSRGKAPGIDAIPAEIYQSGGPALTQKLTELFQNMWSEGTIPQEIKDASIVHLYKKKGNSLATTTGGSPSLPSVEKFLPESS